MFKQKNILLFLLFYLLIPRHSFAEKMDKIIAIVNDDIITDDELNVFMQLSTPPDASLLPEEDLKELRRMLLERMVEDRLILQEAKSQKLEPDEKMIEERIQDIKEKAGSEKAFQEVLKQEGLSLSELRDKLKNQLMIFMVINRNVKSRVNVSPKEVTDFFRENPSQFIRPETVVVDSIFVEDEKKLEELQLELSRGEDFQSLAEKYSQKSNIGEVKRGQLKKDLEDFIFSLEAGKPSGPFKANDGFYIFLLKERFQPSNLLLDDVRAEITAYLENKKTQDILTEWLESLKDKAYISIRQ